MEIIIYSLKIEISITFPYYRNFPNFPLVITGIERERERVRLLYSLIKFLLYTKQ